MPLIRVPLIRVRRAAVAPADALVGRLTVDERDRLDRAAPRDRDPVASSLLLARLAVAEACGVDPGAVRVRRRCPRCGSAAHGVPVADRADGGPAPRLSLTRSPGLVAVALSDDAPVGIDVERVRAGTDDLARVVLAPGEPPAAGPHRLLLTWARTEAVLKAAGTGLAVDPRALRVSDAHGRPAVGVVDGAAGRDLAAPAGVRWWLTDLDAGTTHAGALAALVPDGGEPRLADRVVDLGRALA